jgi:hypothetical protein
MKKSRIDPGKAGEILSCHGVWELVWVEVMKIDERALAALS